MYNLAVVGSVTTILKFGKDDEFFFWEKISIKYIGESVR